MKYLIFVDFDGVLTSNRVHFPQSDDSYLMWSRFDPIVMEFFNKLHFTYDNVNFVWTTSWRNNVNDSLMIEHNLYSQWYNAGFRGFFGKPWRVNPNNTINHGQRAEEINDYLGNYAHGYKDFIVIDDTDYRYNEKLPARRFVRTSSDDGMLFKHMLNAWSLTGNWDRK